MAMAAHLIFHPVPTATMCALPNLLLCSSPPHKQAVKGKEGSRQLHSCSEDMLKFALSAQQVIETTG